MSKKSEAKQKLMEQVFAHVVCADLSSHRYEDNVRVYLPKKLAKAVDAFSLALPPVRIMVAISPKDIAKVRKNAAESCMTAATKASIAKALEGK